MSMANVIDNFDLKSLSHKHIVLLYTERRLEQDLDASLQIAKVLLGSYQISVEDKPAANDSLYEQDRISFQKNLSLKYSLGTIDDPNKHCLTSRLCIGSRDEENLPERGYCISPDTTPISLCYGKIKKEHNLVSPCFLSEEFIKAHYNMHDFKQMDKTYKVTFGLNKHHELVLQDKAILESQRGILKDVIKQAGIMLITGQNVIRMSLPIKIFQPKSQIERLANIFSIFWLLKTSNEKEDDKLDLMKHLVALVSGLFYYAMDLQKPFNPFLGETFQGYFIDGTKIYIEHICHDPSLDSFFITNEKTGLKIYGNIETVAKIGSNELKLSFKGIITLEWKETKFYFTMPTFHNKGLIFGKRRVSLTDNIVMYYPEMELKAIVYYDIEKKVDIIKGGIYKNKNKGDLTSQDSFIASLFPDSKKRVCVDEKVSDISGSWLSSIEVGGKVYWETSMKGFQTKLVLNVLPSDSRFREDLLWLLADNPQLSQKWKTKIEEIQRADRKRREVFRKKLKLNPNIIY